MDKNEEIKYGITEVPPIDKPIKHVEKYWGNMTTLFETDDYSVKKIFMKKGSQSSMEFHIKKVESYYIDSGKLKVGLRVGRGENKSVILEKGDVYHIEPGLVHMRMALEDTIIIEASTKDDDGDSHLIEDGKTYIFKETE